MNINRYLTALAMMMVFVCGVVSGQQRVEQDEKVVTLVPGQVSIHPDED